jgi:hypothetical protein
MHDATHLMKQEFRQAKPPVACVVGTDACRTRMDKGCGDDTPTARRKWPIYATIRLLRRVRAARFSLPAP